MRYGSSQNNMSSIRLFILSSFSLLGPMHGHRLRLEAEERHVPLWADVSVGAVYGAMKRLADEGLLREAGREQAGNRPQRVVYEITPTGQEALVALRREGLEAIWFRYDPFALALAQVSQDEIDSLPTILEKRLLQVKTRLDETRAINDRARTHSDPLKDWALRHTEYRLESEVRYLSDILATAPSFKPISPTRKAR
jgi:DNA-binding PadR family transcriptional regulator